jgi:hypothetical protein
VLLFTESVCILLGVLPLIAGYIRFNLSTVAIGCFAIGLLWLFSRQRYRALAASFGLFILTCAAGIGVWIGLSPILMAFSVLGNLSAWELAGFSHRLRQAAPEDNLNQLEKAYLVQLFSVGGISLVLVLVGLLTRIQIPFGWIFLLVLVAVIGMMQLENRLRRGD